MNRRTKLALARDKNIKAQHAGKRTSADGNTYYEYRENRSDVNRTKRFAKGGSTDELTLEEAKEKFEDSYCVSIPYKYWNYEAPTKRIQKYLNTESKSVGKDLISATWSTNGDMTIISSDSSYNVPNVSEKQYDNFWQERELNEEEEFAKGGSIKQEFLEHPLLIERRSDGTLDVDFDSNNSTGWRYSTDDIGEAVAIMINSKYKKNPKIREIAITPKQLKKSDEKTIVYWLSGGNKAWRFNQADYKHSFDKTYDDLWEKDAKKIKKEIIKLKNIGEVMDFYYKEYLEYPHFYSDALENGYVIDEEDEDYAKGGGVGKIKNIKYKDVIDNYNKITLPENVFLKGNKYVGEASIVDGYNGYDSTPQDGLFGVFEPVGVGQNIWNGFKGYLQDDRGFYLRAKQRRGHNINTEDGKKTYAKGGGVGKIRTISNWNELVKAIRFNGGVHNFRGINISSKGEYTDSAIVNFLNKNGFDFQAKEESLLDRSSGKYRLFKIISTRKSDEVKRLALHILEMGLDTEWSAYYEPLGENPTIKSKVEKYGIDLPLKDRVDRLIYAKGGGVGKDAKLLNEKERFELKVLKGLSGFNNGQSLNGILEIIGFSDYRFSKYASESEISKVNKALNSLIKKGYVEKSGLGYNITKTGADYLRSFNYGTYAKGGEISEDRINEVLDNYMIAALWSSTDMDTDEPLDANYSVSDIAPATRERMYKDVKMFIEDNYDAIEASGSTDEQLGHDLWLTRNGHGAGFFDRGYDKDIEEKLENAAREMKSVDLEVGDDGMIHQLGVFKKGGSLKRSKLAISRDKSVKALHGGKRVSAEGNVYYENRENRSDVNRTKKFSEGGSLKGTSQSDLEETAKYMTNAVKKHSWDLKDLIFYFEKDNDFDYKVRAKIWEEKNVYEMPKTYNNILELLKEIVDGNQGSAKSDKMANGGELTEKEQDLKSKIEAILEKVVPNFYHRVWIHKNFLGDGYNLGILIAASDKTINQVRGQFPQVVSLNLDLSSLELHPQIFGGNGGQSIYRNPNMNDPKEQYLAMKSVKIPFRTPAKEEGAVLKAIEKFAENYKKTLKENIDVLRYTDIVDYDALLSAKKMADGGGVSNENKYKEVNGTSYHTNTPQEVVDVLERARQNGTRIKLYYGDNETGRDWHETMDTTGTIGRSTGSIKVPLLISTSRSHGGGAILTDSIVKIKDTKTGSVLYQHKNYVTPKVEITPSDLSEYTHNVVVDGEIYGRHKSLKSAEILKSKLMADGGSVGNERYIFGIEYKATPTSRVFKKSSLTMSGKDTKEMNDAISNNAELLKKQEGWFEVRTTKTPILKEGGKLDLSKHLHSGRYISLDITPNGNLKITLDEDGRAEVLEMRDDDRNDDYIMSELFDDVRGNSELMYFDDIGAQGFGLTEAPAITDGFYYDDNGNLTDEGHEDSELYYFDNYMIRSFIDKMLEDGYVIFDRVSKSKKMAKGGRVTKNEDVLESFLESNEQVNVKNLSTHYNEHDKEVLLRNYFTLIATRKGMDVKITSKKYYQTTSTIQNKLKSLAAKKGFNIIEVEEFEEGGTIGDSELKSLERSLRSSLSSGKEISEEDLETYLGRELKSEEEVVGYNVRRCFLKPYYKKIK